VRQSGGVVRLESRAGEGTTIRLYLPRAGQAAMADAEPTTDVQNLACGPVLLVDDDTDVRRAAAQMLGQLGCDVAAVASGQAALDRLARGELYDLLLVDIAMPGLNGVETVRRARQIRPDLRVLFMTGYAEPAVAKTWGFDDPLIRKPFRFKELAETIQRVLQMAPGDSARSHPRG
jgi:CheY-like chemotaxis protein